VLLISYQCDVQVAKKKTNFNIIYNIRNGRFVRFYSENKTFGKNRIRIYLHICGTSHLATSLKQIHEQFGKHKRNRRGHRDHA
jgi:hypothetical protein